MTLDIYYGTNFQKKIIEELFRAPYALRLMPVSDYEYV